MNGWDSTSAEAARLVHGDRGDTYGHPAVDYARTVALFKALTGHDLSITDGVAFMACVKLSRIGAAMDAGLDAKTVRDSIVDLAGYADCLYAVWELFPPKPTERPTP